MLKKIVIIFVISVSVIFIGLSVYANCCIVGRAYVQEFIVDFENSKTYGRYQGTMSTDNRFESVLAEYYAIIYMSNPDFREIDSRILEVIARQGLSPAETGNIKCATIGILRNDVSINYYETSFDINNLKWMRNKPIKSTFVNCGSL